MQCCKTRPRRPSTRRLLTTRALAEASWGKSANYSVLSQTQETRRLLGQKHSGLHGQTQSKNNNNNNNNNNTKNQYFYLKYLKF